jgi:short-subunit dehydrogenase
VKTNIVKTSRYYTHDNEAPTKDEMAKNFERFAALTPQQAAQQILRGVERNRGRVLVGKDAKALAWVERLFPESYGKRLSGLTDVLRRN